MAAAPRSSSPVQRARKFSAVLGVLSAKSCAEREGGEQERSSQADDHDALIILARGVVRRILEGGREARSILHARSPAPLLERMRRADPAPVRSGPLPPVGELATRVRLREVVAISQVEFVRTSNVMRPAGCLRARRRQRQQIAAVTRCQWALRARRIQFWARRSIAPPPWKQGPLANWERRDAAAEAHEHAASPADRHVKEDGGVGHRAVVVRTAARLGRGRRRSSSWTGHGWQSLRCFAAACRSIALLNVRACATGLVAVKVEKAFRAAMPAIRHARCL